MSAKIIAASAVLTMVGASGAMAGLPMGAPVPMAGTLGPWGLVAAVAGYCGYLVVRKLRK